MPTIEELRQEASMRMMAQAGGSAGDKELEQAAKELRQAATLSESAARQDVQSQGRVYESLQMLSTNIQQMLQELRQSRMESRTNALMTPPASSGFSMPAFTSLPQLPSMPSLPQAAHIQAQLGAMGHNAYMGAQHYAHQGVGMLASGVGAGAGALMAAGSYGSDMASQSLARMLDDRMLSPAMGGYMVGPRSGLIASSIRGLTGAGIFRDDLMQADRARAMSHQTAVISQSMLNKGLQSGLGMFTGKAAGSTVGGAVGGALFGIPGNMAGSYIGGKVGGAVDVFNPFAYASDRIGDISRGSGVARAISTEMLRGRVGSMQSGAFTSEEATRMGIGMNRVAIRDMDFNSGDIQNLAGQMGQAGLFRGVSDPAQFERRLTRELASMKGIMKTLRLSRDEAFRFMVEIQSDLGHSSPEARQMMANQIYSAAQLTGTSARTALDFARSSARSAAGAGMSASTGATIGTGAMSLAGMSASYGGLDPRLLASVGGQQGLANLLARSQQSYLGGTMGTLMGLGGGSFTSLNQGMMNAQGRLGSGMDVMDFMANRHSRVDDAVSKLGPQGVSASQGIQLYQMAKQMGMRSPRDIRNAMQMLAVQMGMASNPQEAEALVRSFGSIQGAASREMALGRERMTDLEADRALAQGGLRGQITQRYRRAMNTGDILPESPFAKAALKSSLTPLGAMASLSEGAPLLASVLTPDTYLRAQARGGGMQAYYEEATTTTSRIADRMEVGYRNIRDGMAGIERDRFNAGDAKGVGDRFKVSKKFGRRGGGGAASQNISSRASMLMGSAGPMRKVIEDAKSSPSKKNMERAAKVAHAIKAGISLGSLQEIDAYQGKASGEEMRMMFSGAGLSTPALDKSVAQFAGEDTSGVSDVVSQSEIRRTLRGMYVDDMGMKGEDTVAALGDERVLEMRQLIKDYLSSYDRSQGAFGGGTAAMQYGKRIVDLYTELTNEPSTPQHVTEFMKRMLQSAGLSVQGDRLTRSGEFLTGYEAGETKSLEGMMSGGRGDKTRLDFFVDDEKFNKLRESADTRRKSRAVGASFDRGASSLAGTFGVRGAKVGAGGGTTSNIDEKSRLLAQQLASRAMTKQGRAKLVEIAKKGKGPEAQLARVALNVGMQQAGEGQQIEDAGGKLMHMDDLTELTRQTVMTSGSKSVEGAFATGTNMGASAADSQSLTLKEQQAFFSANVELLKALTRAVNPNAAIPEG